MARATFQNLNDLPYSPFRRLAGEIGWFHPLTYRARSDATPAVECRSERAYLSINARPCHSVVHFPVWAGLRGSSGLKEDLPTYLAALLGVSNQFQDDTLRLPLACQRVLSQVTGLVSIDLTIVALDGAVVPIVGVS
jgi:hypothetical protein